MALLATATKDDWDSRRSTSRAAVGEYTRIKERFAASDPNVRPTGLEYDRLRARLVELPGEYAKALPIINLSRCPICNKILKGPFDPWGFDGFWWVPKLRGSIEPPNGCEHFRILQGAVSLQSHPIVAGVFEARLGPDAPFVIPRLFGLATMTAVIHSVAMQPGYSAYPIAYFSSESPAIGSLTQGWIEASYSYKDATGRMVWTVRNDPWDFDLDPWIAKGCVRWTIPDSEEPVSCQRPANALTAIPIELACRKLLNRISYGT